MNRYTMAYLFALALIVLELIVPALSRRLLANQQQRKEVGKGSLPRWMTAFFTWWADISWKEAAQNFALLLGFLLVLMQIRPTLVVGSSMDSTLYNGELLCTVSAEATGSATPKRGDIVCLQLKEESNILVKRIIGMPGDYICLIQGSLHINGQQVYENYIREPMAWENRCYAYRLGEDQYFVLGDNRNDSRDSRSFGLVSRDEILSVAKIGIGKWGVTVFRQPEVLAGIKPLAIQETMKGE